MMVTLNAGGLRWKRGVWDYNKTRWSKILDPEDKIAALSLVRSNGIIFGV
jgi:hypothetical protein